MTNELGEGYIVKKKAIIIIALFLLLTVADMSVTYLGTPTLIMEANPVVSHLGAGWGGLIVSNLITLVIYAVLVWYSYVIYILPPSSATSWKEYLKETDQYKPVGSFFAMVGYALGWSMIISRLIPVGEWLILLSPLSVDWYWSLRGAIPFGRLDLWLAIILTIVFCVLWNHRNYRLTCVKKPQLSGESK